MANEKKEADVKAAIRQRLQRVCAHMAPDEFESLIDKIAINQLRAARSTWGNKPPPEA